MDSVKAQKLPINIVGSSKFGRYKKISDELTVNMFISDGFLVNFDGYQKVLELLASGKGRGAFTSNRGNFLLIVINANVYRISTTLGITLLGTLSTYNGEVTIDENLNNQVCIVDKRYAYIYNHSKPANLTRVVDHSLGGDPSPIDTGALKPNYVSFHQTFFLFGNGNTTGDGAAWYVYEYDSDYTIRYNSQFSLSIKPDYALAALRIPSQSSNVLVLGKVVGEIHSHVGGEENYRRNKSFSVDFGVASVDTIAANDKFVTWLGINQQNQPFICVFTGQSVERISTDGIDYLLSNIEHPERSTAVMFRKDGHMFYILTFYDPADNLTVMYDFNNEQFFNLTDEHLNYFPANQIVSFNRKTYFVSLNNGSLYELSSDITTYNDNLPGARNPDLNINHPIQRIRITEPVRMPDSARFIANTLVFTIEQGHDDFFVDFGEIIIIGEDGTPMISQDGIQIIPENGRDPNAFVGYLRSRVDLAISRDGGYTYGNYVSRELNKLAERRNIFNYQRMGAANDLRFKFRFWGFNRFVVGNGVLEIKS